MTEAAAETPRRRRLRLLRIHPIWLVLAVLLVAIAVQNPMFVEPVGYMNFLKRAAPLAILAAGQLYVIVSGGFDLSAGSVITLTVVGSSMLLGENPDATALVILAMLGMGVAVGLVNGLVVAILRVPSLIATLGMLITLNGMAFLWSGGAPRGYLPEAFRFLGRHNFREAPVVGFLPVAVVALVVLALLLAWGMHRTNYGRLLHAVGDNPRLRGSRASPSPACASRPSSSRPSRRWWRECCSAASRGSRWTWARATSSRRSRPACSAARRSSAGAAGCPRPSPGRSRSTPSSRS